MRQIIKPNHVLKRSAQLRGRVIPEDAVHQPVRASIKLFLKEGPGNVFIPGLSYILIIKDL